MTRRRHRVRRSPVHVVVTWIRRLVEAFRHAITGGSATRRQAQRRATQPARRCSKCHQPIPHSSDWRDHLAH
jgi:hypothetical protein